MYIWKYYQRKEITKEKGVELFYKMTILHRDCDGLEF